MKYARRVENYHQRDVYQPYLFMLAFVRRVFIRAQVCGKRNLFQSIRTSADHLKSLTARSVPACYADDTL